MYLYDLMKTLTTLNLRSTGIGDRVVQDLANALKYNTVRLYLFSSMAYIFV